MAEISVKQFTDFSVTGTITDSSGDAIDIAGGGCRLTMVGPDGVQSLDKAGSITDGAAGEYAISVTDIESGAMVAGTHQCEVTLLDAAGNTRKTQNFEIVVRRALAPSAGVTP